MRFILFALLLPLSLTLFGQEDSLRIEWSETHVLSWSDFQGNEDEELKLSALSSIAIPYTLTSDGEVDMTVSLSTIFLKNESWYKKGKENKVLLGHEQLHFDIAEINRRLIVKELLRSKISRENYEEELNEVITKIWDNDYRKMQDKYDKDTNYARFFQGQVDWEKIVAKKLRELNEYKTQKLTITFQ